MVTLTIGGKTFTDMLCGGADRLAAYRQDVNDLNVAQSITSLNSDVKMIEMTSNYQRQILFNF